MVAENFNLRKAKNMKKVLITGAKGQLGHKIQEILGIDYELVLTDSDNMDITDAELVDSFVSKAEPDYIIHAAAYTQVDKAEDDKELCEKINVLGTLNIANSASKYGATLIYVSTDYVFDGLKSEPYLETDAPNPLSVYGATKLKGEEYVSKTCEKHYILRVSWLFGELPVGHPGSNFVETMLRLASSRDSLGVVDDQVGSPTYTGDLVRVMKSLLDSASLDAPAQYGLYHFSGKGACSWYDFAKEIFLSTGTKIDLKAITSMEYPQKATRPRYSYLDKGKIEGVLGTEVRGWKEMLGEYLKNR